MSEEIICNFCHHTLIDNNHGPDQTDYIYDCKINDYKYSGKCIYCKTCNPVNSGEIK